jgi:hypothetical protein
MSVASSVNQIEAGMQKPQMNITVSRPYLVVSKLPNDRRIGADKLKSALPQTKKAQAFLPRPLFA